MTEDHVLVLRQSIESVGKDLRGVVQVGPCPVQLLLLALVVLVELLDVGRVDLSRLLELTLLSSELGQTGPDLAGLDIFNFDRLVNLFEVQTFFLELLDLIFELLGWVCVLGSLQGILELLHVLLLVLDGRFRASVSLIF